MKFVLLLILFSTSFIVNEARVSEQLKVTLSHGGGLIGRYLSSHSGRGIRAFLGVPYAEPPIGDLRFRSPVPKKPWSGYRNASSDVEPCLQYYYLFRRYEPTGNEDCLYLNVYVPQEPKTKKLPVMVYIYGGAFHAGTGGRDFYGPDYLLDHDVILVTGNYRLGVFGFLSTNTLDSPGNYGLKDQNLMLRWIQENIGVFGGDKNSVTIFGNSAGGASVTYHTISPLSQGLFQRGIAQSGTHFARWAFRDARAVAKTARKLADDLNCPSSESNPGEMVECLRSKPAEELNSRFFDFFMWDIHPITIWSPVVEPPHKEAFLVEHPFKASRGRNVPLMIGITSGDGIMTSSSILWSPELVEDLKLKWNSVLPPIFTYQDYSKDVEDKITDMITKFYVDELSKNLYEPTFFKKFTDSVTDGYFGMPVDMMLQFRAQNDYDSKTFLYVYNHVGDASFAQQYQQDVEADYGVCHMDEIISLFPVLKENFFSAVPKKEDDVIRKIMLYLWVNFATYGNPTPHGKESLSTVPRWDPVGLFPYNYLRIGKYNQTKDERIEMEKGFYSDRLLFWRNIVSILEDNPIDID